jgi:hypothetical protein
MKEIFKNYFFLVQNFSKGWPLLSLALSLKNPSYLTAHIEPFFKSIKCGMYDKT